MRPALNLKSESPVSETPNTYGIYELFISSPDFDPVQTFDDVLKVSTFYEYIEAVADAKITLGDGKGNYLPGDYVTCGQIAAFLSRDLDL